MSLPDELRPPAAFDPFFDLARPALGGWCACLEERS